MLGCVHQLKQSPCDYMRTLCQPGLSHATCRASYLVPVCVCVSLAQQGSGAHTRHLGGGTRFRFRLRLPLCASYHRHPAPRKTIRTPNPDPHLIPAPNPDPNLIPTPNPGRQAPRVIELHRLHLDGRVQAAALQCAKIKAHMTMVEGGLRELMQLPGSSN